MGAFTSRLCEALKTALSILWSFALETPIHGLQLLLWRKRIELKIISANLFILFFYFTWVELKRTLDDYDAEDGVFETSLVRQPYFDQSRGGYFCMSLSLGAIQYELQKQPPGTLFVYPRARLRLWNSSDEAILPVRQLDRNMLHVLLMMYTFSFMVSAQ
jgi:hypothetical protein